MKTGIVFDIREFTLHDGPGIRTSVFFKGCPLRCAWCHNPEGLSPRPQAITAVDGSVSTKGREYRADELAVLLNRQVPILNAAGGGITFSGGEPLAQAPFILEVLRHLAHTHIVLDTSGQALSERFYDILPVVDLVYFDVKLIDPEQHRRWTGLDNRLILHNLGLLGASGVPYMIRVPLIPGVTDTMANYRGIADFIQRLDHKPDEIDLLSYNRAAGGKYRSCGLEFNPGYDESLPNNRDTSPFEGIGVPVRIF